MARMTRSTTMTQRRHRHFAGFPELALFALIAGSACSGDAGGAGPAGTARRVTVTGRGEDGAPTSLAWVAFQDGDGPWQKAAESAGVYTFDAPSGRYGALFFCDAPIYRHGEFVAATVAELDTIQFPCPGAPAAKHAWKVAIKGLPAGKAASVAFASLEAGTWPVSASAAGFAVDLPPGTYDLVGAVDNTFAIKRAIKVDGPGSAELDLGSGTVTAKVQPLPTVAADTTEILEWGSFFSSPRGARISLSAPKGSVALLDPGDLAPGDSQQVFVEARGKQGAFRGFSQSVAGGPLPALSLPPPLAGITAAVIAKTPAVRARISVDRYPDARFYQANLFTDMPDAPTWLMNVGAGWMEGRSSFELPDLAAIPGFNPAWSLPPDRAVAAAVVAVASTRPIAPILDDQPPSGPGVLVTYGKKLITLAPLP